MKIVSAKTEESENGERQGILRKEDNKYAEVVLIPQEGQKLYCVCGYELVKEDETTWECTGGNHKFHFEDGETALDKFGNVCRVARAAPKKEGSE